MGALETVAGTAEPAVELSLRILKLENRLQRERTARLHAEEIAERGLRDLYERQRQLELLSTIATRANHSRSVEEPLTFALEAICQHTGWALGNVFLLNYDSTLLEPTPMWHAGDPEKLADFIAISQTLTFVAGQGLPGRVLASGVAEWIEDAASDPNFPRARAAARCGLHAAFAFPILVGTEVLAVMEFFHRETLAPDEQLLTVMGQIGTQLGRVMERRRAEEKLIHDATHDPLTGLPNRMLFTDRLKRAVALKTRKPDSRYAVLFIDLDRFKLVNDSLGHAAGDALLVEIAARFAVVLESACHGGILPTLARLGGDEFTILLEGEVDGGQAIEIANRIQDALARPVEVERQKVYTSASIGIASCATDYTSAADIMRDADLAMYRAKASGRARVEMFDKSLHDIAIERLTLESDLRGALHNGEFVLHYQPIVALDDSRVTGFEALVRWQRHATGELVPPGDFITLAEDTGLIVFIGDWIMREAFRALAGWQRDGVAGADITMSVNVSPRQFHQHDFVAGVLSAIRDTGIAASCVRLEITESVPILDAGRTATIISELRQAGIRVSIDDFGTGYSSLSYLHKLPFDVLKIDRSFVASLKEKADGHEIIQTILDLARNMGMEVIAEGAETAAHVDTLREMGCGFAQGYFFSRPVDANAARQLLEDAKAGQAARTIVQ